VTAGAAAVREALEAAGIAVLRPARGLTAGTTDRQPAD
jgi:hypothetical protein